MKIVIFAGGIGTRLWPLSRKNSPKQFDRIFNNQSTLELAIQRIAPVFGLENIFIQTAENFKQPIKKLIPDLPADNILTEPARRNLAPAVCLAMTELKKRNYTEPVALLWADHLMKDVDEFTHALQVAEGLIKENPNRFVFLAEKPRFANNNLGWIHVGGDNKFLGWKYKPEQGECDKMFKSGQYFWNPGYFITNIDFLLEQYKTLAPEIYQAVTENNYTNAPKVNFDEAIIEKTDLGNAVVIKTDMGWSDPGTLYALKEALQKSVKGNVTQGQVVNLDSQDCLTYNLEPKKLLTTVGLKGTVVINTKDAIIVVPKDKVKQVTDLVAKLEKQGLEEYL